MSHEKRLDRQDVYLLNEGCGCFGEHAEEVYEDAAWIREYYLYREVGQT